MGIREKVPMKDPMLKHYSSEWVQELDEKRGDIQFEVEVDVVQDGDNQDEQTSQIQ